MTTFATKLASMQAAQSEADQLFMATLAPLRDAYVLTGSAHVETETAWLNSFADEALQDAASATWAAVQQARADLGDAVTAANAERDAYLAAAWAWIEAGGTWPPLLLDGTASGSSGAAGEVSAG